jgi:GrpB-like predicted nucleotidyltransferase (UPF0157 family)
MEQYGGGAILVSDYDPAWPEMFKQEQANLQSALGPLILTIEHMGSTAVPGLAAKPIIDLLVGVRNLRDARSCCIEPLQALGYTYMPEYESWLPDELFFARKFPDLGRTMSISWNLPIRIGTPFCRFGIICAPTRTRRVHTGI